MTIQNYDIDFNSFAFDTKSQLIDQIYFEIEAKYEFDFERFLIIYPVICKSLDKLYHPQSIKGE